LENDPVDGITFTAVFSKALTTPDGGWRLQLDLSQDSGQVIADIAKLNGVNLQVAIVPIVE